MWNCLNDAPSPNPPIVVLKFFQAGQVKRDTDDLYIKSPNVATIRLTSDQLFIIFKIATIRNNMTEQITNEVDLFGLIIYQNVIENKFNREYVSLATIQQGKAIEFKV